jgi:PPOX class probable F420-dependent enzyme
MPTISGSGLPDGSLGDRISASRIGRMATVRSDGTPHVVPITFAISNDMVVTAVDAKPKRTTNLQRLRNLRTNPAVSIVVDHYADDWSALWWIRVDGLARIVEADDGVGDAPERAAAIEALVAKYPQYQATAPDGPVIIVQPTRWTVWSASELRP